MGPAKKKSSKSKERNVAPLLKGVTVEKIDETVKAAAAASTNGVPIPVDSDSDDAASTARPGSTEGKQNGSYAGRQASMYLTHYTPGHSRPSRAHVSSLMLEL